jgi:hypothetical protein
MKDEQKGERKPHGIAGNAALATFLDRSSSHVQRKRKGISGSGQRGPGSVVQESFLQLTIPFELPK